MPLHTFGFAGAKTDSTANEAAPAPADSSLTRTANANQYLMPYDANIVMAAALNDTITRARFNYPSYRDLGLPEIFPVSQQATFAAAYQICNWGMQGPRVKKTEEFGADSSNGASTVDQIGVVVTIADSIAPIQPGRRFTVRGTSVQTLVANAYSLGGITLDQTLPFGRYGVIGIYVACANGLLARLIFTSNTYYRPGVPVGNTFLIEEPLQSLRSGKYGLLGTFDQTSPPNLEILGLVGGAQTAAVYLDLVEISRGP